MKKLIYLILIGATISSMMSCKKKEEEVQPAPVRVQTTKADDAAARNELDKVYRDIEDVYNSQEYADQSKLCSRNKCNTRRRVNILHSHLNNQIF